MTIPISLTTLNPQFIVGSVWGNLIAFIFGPDSDLELITHSENLVGKVPVVGPLIKALLIAVTLPYATVIDHRSHYSHMPILSDIIRYLYLEVLIFLISLVFDFYFPTLVGSVIAFTRTGLGHGFIDWLNFVSSPMFWGYFLTAIIQTSVHSLILDGGMLYQGRKRKYVFGKEWYRRCKSWFN